MENIKIIQVIPCTSDLLAVYDTAGNEPIISKVEYMGLGDDGVLHGLTLFVDGKYIVCDTIGNFKGLCKRETLKEFLVHHELPAPNKSALLALGAGL